MNLVKKIGLLVGFGMLCLSIASINAVNVHAAEKTGNGVVSLNTWKNDSYSKADLTGNGKNDKVETISNGKKLTLKVNGKKLKSWSGIDSSLNVSIQVVKLSKKRAYLEITTESFKSYKTTAVLYQVKKGKLSTVVNYEKLIKNKLLMDNDFITKGYGFDMIYATKVKSNTIYLHASLGTKSLGQIQIENLQLKYSGGKFKLKNTAGKITNKPHIDYGDGPFNDTFKAAKAIQTYKAAGSSKKGIKISKNTKFTVKKGAVIGKQLYIQVKTSAGKTGWIKLSTSKSALVKVRSIVMWG